MTHDQDTRTATLPPSHLSCPSAPYLVIEVGGPRSGMVMGDYQTREGAEIGRGMWRRLNKRHKYVVISQEQRREAA